MNEAELMKFLTDHGEHIQMTPDPECSPFWAIDGPSLKSLFAGKKLVDAGVVVLSLADATYILDALTNPQSQRLINLAIEQARGKV